MAGLIFLGLALLCAFIGRIMLMVAAFGVSIWWGLGVFLPFGPIFFRLSYPDLANPSRWVRLATLPCLFMYFLLSPEGGSTAYYRHKIKGTHPPPQTIGYAIEATARKFSRSKRGETSNKPQLTVPERVQANVAEFDRLHRWNEALTLRKRDLLKSDAEGNRAYNLELARYNEALQNAGDERALLSAGK